MEEKYFEGRWYTLLRNTALTLFAITVLSIIGSIGFYADKWRFGYFETVAQWGAFGDFFGGILNPLIAFTGVVLLAFTLYQNHIALSQTTKELRLSVGEMKRSAEATEGQRRLMMSEATEKQFLNLLSYLSKKLEYVMPREIYQSKYGMSFSATDVTVTSLSEKYIDRYFHKLHTIQQEGTPDFYLTPR